VESRLRVSSINKHQQATKIGLLKNINKFKRLAYVRFERISHLIAHENLASPLAIIAKSI